MRNPKWHREEIILALDLYFHPDRGSISSTNPKIVALSETLNKLNLSIARPDKERFRNANGVSLKLSNFLAIDSKYNGSGMRSHSKLDKAVFDEYKDEISSLKQEAQKIIHKFIE